MIPDPFSTMVSDQGEEGKGGVCGGRERKRGGREEGTGGGGCMSGESGGAEEGGRGQRRGRS